MMTRLTKPDHDIKNTRELRDIRNDKQLLKRFLDGNRTVQVLTFLFFKMVQMITAFEYENDSCRFDGLGTSLEYYFDW